MFTLPVKTEQAYLIYYNASAHGASISGEEFQETDFSPSFSMKTGGAGNYAAASFAEFGQESGQKFCAEAKNA